MPISAAILTPSSRVTEVDRESTPPKEQPACRADAVPDDSGTRPTRSPARPNCSRWLPAATVGPASRTNSANDFDPAWAPDGTQIVFTSDRMGGTYHLFTMKPDGTGVTQLTNAGALDEFLNWQARC
jgi:hypothetical protein